MQRVVSLVVRGVIVGLLVLALSGLSMGVGTGRQMVLFLVDRSASVSEEALVGVEEYIREAAEGMRVGDRYGVMHFAEGVTAPRTEDWGGAVSADWADRGTEAGMAVQAGLANLSPDYGGRLVVLSDGHATGVDPVRVLGMARGGGTPVDVVPLPSSTDAEVLVERVEAPAEVRSGEPFELAVWIRSSEETEADLAVYANGIRTHEETVPLRAGENQLRFRQVAGTDNIMRYRVTASAQADRLVDNNTGSALIRTRGEPKALLIDPRPQDGRYLRWALEQEDIELEVRSVRGIPRTLTELRNHDLLVFSDVPAHELSEPQMAAIRSYVRDFGGGFLMLGGEQSFGLGGYYRTVLEDLLPLRTDFERERETPSLGMVLVIDKSGSMAGIKIELAKEAAKAAAELLDARDQVGVIAFDGRPSWVCELHSAADRSYIVDRISSLQSGGGTDMGPAIRAAYQALETAAAGLKHVIVLTDGHSAPDEYYALVTSMRSSGITVSTVAVGETADRDLLAHIAGWGDGRYYYASDPYTIPQIFAKETMTAARSAMREAPFLAQPAMAHPVMQGVALEEAPFLLGFVRTRAKPTSEVVLATEGGEPLLAFWRYGLGQVGGFTSDAKNRWAAEWVEWPGFSRFWAQIFRHLLRSEEAGGMQVWARVDGDGIEVVAETPVDQGWGLQSASTGGLEMTVMGPDLVPREQVLEASAPGRYRGRIEETGMGDYHIRVSRREAGQVVAEAGTALALPYPEELRIEPTDEAALRNWASAGGGRFDPPPAAIFGEGRLRGSRAVRLWPWLLSAAILLLPLDVALRRIEWSRLGGSAR